ncbi:unnamed protein product [Caenorhabditis brenneri]
MEKEKSKSKKIWLPPIEKSLVDFGGQAQPLWVVRESSDIGEHEMEEFRILKEKVNGKHGTEFNTDEVIRKWLEFRLLFDIKFAMNGYTMEDRGHHIRRDGSLKDDLNESWVLFKSLGYLADPDAKLKRRPRNNNFRHTET